MQTVFSTPGGLQLGSIVSGFVADSSHGKIDFLDYTAGYWTFLFSHPKDRTPVCTTEVADIASQRQEFEALGVKVLGFSGDSVDDHMGWIAEIEKTFDVNVSFPIIADPTGKIANRYGMIHPKVSEGECVRKSIVIDPSHRVRFICEYPMEVGRSSAEILRVIRALQLTEKHAVATPAAWAPGVPVIIPMAQTNDTATRRFGQNWVEVLPYLRAVYAPE